MASAVTQHLKRLYKDDLKRVDVDISHREYTRDQVRIYFSSNLLVDDDSIFIYLFLYIKKET